MTIVIAWVVGHFWTLVTLLGCVGVPVLFLILTIARVHRVRAQDRRLDRARAVRQTVPPPFDERDMALDATLDHFDPPSAA